MLKYILHICLILFIICAIPSRASAQILGINNAPQITVGGAKITAMDSLVDGISKMTRTISDASKEMMKIGDMLICNSLHGEAAQVKIGIEGFSVTLYLVALDIFVSGCVLYVLGFFISIIASFYMFDIAFNLSLSIVLLPIVLALWPFAWTKGKLKIVVESIAYYTGLFIFLPLGILIGTELVVTIIQNAFVDPSGAPIPIQQVFDEDKSDIIRDNLGVFTLTFLKVLISYIVAIRIIPLMANEFCSHFFDGALVGSPMSEKMTQVIALAKQKTIGKATKFGKDVAKHQIGKAIENKGNSKGGFMGGVMARYGKQLAKTKK